MIAFVAAAAATVPAPHAVELLVGEALVQQSSGDHRPQLGVVVSANVPVRGRFGFAPELLGTFTTERSAALTLDQYLARPALLATVTFARPETLGPVLVPGRPPRLTPWLSVDAGVGPAATFTIARWSRPDLGTLLLVEPALRGRFGLTVGLGEHLRVRGQGGLAARLTGVDHDYTVGMAWAW